MEKVEPPAPEEVARLIVRARLLFPEHELFLGCARPIGKKHEILDSFALRAGVNGIAYPADGLAKEATELGLAPRFYPTCCSVA
jgi:hypothetical protein